MTPQPQTRRKPRARHAWTLVLGAAMLSALALVLAVPSGAADGVLGALQAMPPAAAGSGPALLRDRRLAFREPAASAPALNSTASSAPSASNGPAANALLPGAAQPAAWSEHRIATPDGSLAYASMGQGPVLVVLPGGPGGSGYGLRPWFRVLAQEHTVVVLDNIGRGRSARLADPSRYTVDRDAEDVERLRRHLGVATLAVYGHSYGGLVAQAYASRYPQAVDHLVLGNTLHGARSWQAQIDHFEAQLQRHHPERWQALQTLREQGLLSGSREAQGLLGEAFAPLYWADRAASHPKAAPSGDPRDALNLDVYRAMLGPDPERRVGGTLAGVELLPRLKAVSAPTLLLTGRYDPVAPPQVLNEMREALGPQARAQTEVFEQSGHRPFIEQGAAWAARVQAFLRSPAAQR